MFSAQAMAAASVSEIGGHSSSTVISTNGTTSGRPVITDITSESNNLALILVCGCMNKECDKRQINAALLQKEYTNNVFNVECFQLKEWLLPVGVRQVAMAL